MTRNQKPSATAQLDVICNTLLGFIFLFVFALLLISKKVKEEDKAVTPTNGEYVVVVQWDDKSNDDVDTYVGGPEGKLVFFQRREDGLLHLERDDLGARGDLLHGEDGSEVKVEKNEERVVVRGIVPGEYIVNVHMYRKEDKNAPNKVRIALIDIRSRGAEITKNEVALEKDGDERTAFRFVLSPDGKVASINHLPYSFIHKD